MSSAGWSFIVHLSPDRQGSTIQIWIVQVEEATPVHLNRASFMIRAAVDAERTITRCLVRHLSSGREAYLQTGSALPAFLGAYLVPAARSSAFPPEPAP